jgi:uncharacterized membrane protein YfcA
MCFHKDLWPLLPIEWVGIIIVPLAAMIAAPTGVGTGSILTPFFIVFFGFSVLETIPIKIPIIVVLAINRLILMRNYQEEGNFVDVSTGKPAQVLALDYGMVTLILPTMLIGANIGVLINRTLANWFALILISMIIAQAGFTTWKRFFRERAAEIKKENEKKAQVAEALIPAEGASLNPESEKVPIDDKWAHLDKKAILFN